MLLAPGASEGLAVAITVKYNKQLYQTPFSPRKLFISENCPDSFVPSYLTSCRKIDQTLKRSLHCLLKVSPFNRATPFIHVLAEKKNKSKQHRFS